MELLKAGDEAMIYGLHAVLTAVWQSGTIPSYWKRGLIIPNLKEKVTVSTATYTGGSTLLCQARCLPISHIGSHQAAEAAKT